MMTSKTTTTVNTDETNATSVTTRKTQEQRPARFLVGIFSVARDIHRRNLIRRGLQVYNDSRLCSFGSSSNGIIPPSPPPPNHCELMYTFVLGANPQGSKQIVDDDNNKHDNIILLSQPPIDWNMTSEPNDITYLNIQENMNEGKSPTWFYYASRVMKAHDWDYAVKCDSDTGIRVDMFLDFAHDNLPRGATGIYAGKMAPMWKPGDTFYLQGQFYILSRDVAQRVAQIPVQDHMMKNDTFVDEDAIMGNIILKHIPHVHVLVTGYSRTWNGRKMMPWKHGMKNETRYERWISGEAIRLQGNVT